MLLLEHHGKALLRRHGIATPSGVVAADAHALEDALATLPERLVLKAQIAGGRRGKAGGVVVAAGAAEARRAFAALLGRSFDGQTAEAVLVEECVAFQCERYAGFMIDGGEMRLLFARAGGVDIEDITVADAANLAIVPVDPLDGPDEARLRDAFARLGYAPEYWDAYACAARALFDASHAHDATLVEINPLAELPGGRLVALDARIVIDDAALGRQPAIAALQLMPTSDAHTPAAVAGLKLRRNAEGGVIGLIGLGSGLNLTLMDWIAGVGSRAAILVDIDEAIGAGCAAQGFAAAFETFDRDPTIRAVLVNIITCSYRLDDIVAALVPAMRDRAPSDGKPVVLHLRGNRMAMAEPLLAAAGLPNSPSITAAIKAVVAAAKG